MTSNYEAICEKNRKSWGTKGGQTSGKLAAELYDNRTHFIFELLQNAEDALGRRGEWRGSRGAAFTLTPTCLTLSHFGKPFDEADVQSICDIAESTKNESSIGRFGLGFKSVYTVTDLPEIHSGDEDFVIQDYVYPTRLARSARRDDETQILLPLKPEDASAAQEITAGFRHLGPRVLLFLRHIDEINWKVVGGASGFYRRNKPESLGRNVQRITVIGKEDDQPEIDQNWLVFHREVFSDRGQKIGRVEIAFSLVAVTDAPGRWAVQPLAKSPLVVFFPTVVESYLGFLIQGPYLTTPSRDNIKHGEPWNAHLVMESSGLLVEALRWMRDAKMLDVAALRCLPLDREKFAKDSWLAPMFDAVLQGFQDEALLPTFDGGYVTARQAKLASTQDLRELLTPKQVSTLLGSEVTAWLSGDITNDKAPEIRNYVVKELEIDEITPFKLVQKLTKSFLEDQPDEWVLRLYKFLDRQKALRPLLNKVPLIRLDDGTHVVAQENGKAMAFLPSAIATSFPTMRRACVTDEVLSFLTSLEITEPDPVDDVIWHLLPKYQQDKVEVNDEDYAADIQRILVAYGADSTTQKKKLQKALQETKFVKAVDTGDGRSRFAKPKDVYLATERLRQLFAGVPGIWIVNSEYDFLRGGEISDMLVSCGASRYLTKEATPSEMGESEKAQIRREAGLERAKWQLPPDDFTLRGLTALLDFLPTLQTAHAAARAKVLWESLADLEQQGTSAFYGSYTWSYSHETKTANFQAKFVRILNQVAWVPTADGELVPPKHVLFDNLGWKPNPFLLTEIIFKSPIIDQLAKEAGFDPAILDLLRMHGLTNVEDLTSRLGITKPPAEPETNEPTNGDVYDAAKDLYGDDMPDIPPVTPDPNGNDDVGTGWQRGSQSRSEPGNSRGVRQDNQDVHGRSGNSDGDKGPGKGGSQENRTPGHTVGRPFISYIALDPEVEIHDPDGSDRDGLDHDALMEIERCAIDLIIRFEPALRRTPEGNPGFDLFEADSSGKQTRWVEVKSMTGTLKDRPVGLSHKQFNFAREKGDAYWLYVVEYASDPAQVQLLKIQNPVGRARTFTFDHGWSEVAQIYSLH